MFLIRIRGIPLQIKLGQTDHETCQTELRVQLLGTCRAKRAFRRKFSIYGLSGQRFSTLNFVYILHLIIVYLKIRASLGNTHFEHSP